MKKRSIIGFILLVLGVGLFSVPAALIVAGLVLFLSGGAAYAARRDSD